MSAQICKASLQMFASWLEDLFQQAFNLGALTSDTDFERKAASWTEKLA